MNIKLITQDNTNIAIVTDHCKVITDTRSALDLIMTVKYETGANKIVISKKAITEDFFILSTGLAGEILQKFINYQIKAAIWGDYSRYTSKPLQDFIYESNQGKDFFFVATETEAIEKLTETID